MGVMARSMPSLRLRSVEAMTNISRAENVAAWFGSNMRCVARGTTTVVHDEIEHAETLTKGVLTERKKNKQQKGAGAQ